MQPVVQYTSIRHLHFWEGSVAMRARLLSLFEDACMGCMLTSAKSAIPSVNSIIGIYMQPYTYNTNVVHVLPAELLKEFVCLD